MPRHSKRSSIPRRFTIGARGAQKGVEAPHQPQGNRSRARLCGLKTAHCGHLPRALDAHQRRRGVGSQADVVAVVAMSLAGSGGLAGDPRELYCGVASPADRGMGFPRRRGGFGGA